MELLPLVAVFDQNYRGDKKYWDLYNKLFWTITLFILIFSSGYLFLYTKTNLNIIDYFLSRIAFIIYGYVLLVIALIILVNKIKAKTIGEDWVEYSLVMITWAFLPITFVSWLSANLIFLGGQKPCLDFQEQNGNSLLAFLFGSNHFGIVSFC